MTLSVEFEEFETGAWQSEYRFGCCSQAFDEDVTSFLSTLSRLILGDRKAKSYPDLVAFAFFIRKANLKKMLGTDLNTFSQRGWGTVLHIAASNIPLNFAYSLVFSMLAGNSNIVRLPSQTHEQSFYLIKIIEKILLSSDFEELYSKTLFIKSERGSDRLADVASIVDGLVVWGGDHTVKHFMDLPKKVGVVELYFPSKVSSCLINLDSFVALSDDSQLKLAEKFYNDTFLFDQNACSSPSKCFWVLGKFSAFEKKKTFWDNLEIVKKRKGYKISAMALVDRSLDIFQNICVGARPYRIEKHSNSTWLVQGSYCDDPAGRFGLFNEISVSRVSDVFTHLRQNEQTLTYFGFDRDEILKEMQKQDFCNIDRLVPIGSALEMSHIWDGKNIINVLSRALNSC